MVLYIPGIKGELDDYERCEGMEHCLYNIHPGERMKKSHTSTLEKKDSLLLFNSRILAPASLIISNCSI
jgi:hypothetical protein